MVAAEESRLVSQSQCVSTVCKNGKIKLIMSGYRYLYLNAVQWVENVVNHKH